MLRRKYNRKKIGFLFLGLFLLLAIFLSIKLASFYNNIYTKKNGSGIIKKPYVEKTAYNILIMGYGGAGHQGAYLTDTMMVAHIDTKKRDSTLISIPRDIWVRVPTSSGSKFHSKINAVYQMGLFPNNYPDIPAKYEGEQGAGELVKEVVKTVTGLEIDNYVAIDFAGFEKGVDLLGGVDISVARTFDDFEYPIAGYEDDLCGKQESDLPELEKIATESPEIAFPCRYEHLHFDAGLQHMDGVTALKFVRSRHSNEDGGDLARASRQQLFLDSVKSQVISLGFIPKAIPLLDELGDHIKTDVDPILANKLILSAEVGEDYTMSQFVLDDKAYITATTSSNGQFILIPTLGEDKWSAVHKAIAGGEGGI